MKEFQVSKHKILHILTQIQHRSFDKFTITGLVDFPSDTEHSTSTFRSV